MRRKLIVFYAYDKDGISIHCLLSGTTKLIELKMCMMVIGEYFKECIFV